MPDACSFERCESCTSNCPAAVSKNFRAGATIGHIIDLSLSCLLFVLSAMAFRRFLSQPGSSFCRWTAHQTFHFSHVIFCVFRILTDSMAILFRKTVHTNKTVHLSWLLFEALMVVAGTYMWLSLMFFWYQVTMPPKAHLKGNLGVLLCRMGDHAGAAPLLHSATAGLAEAFHPGHSESEFCECDCSDPSTTWPLDR